MKRLFSTRRGLVVGTAVLGIVSLGVAAFAYWTSSGSSNGSATTAAIGPWTVVAPVVTAADLSPGGSVDTTSYSVTNGGTGNQHLSVVDISVANSNGSVWTSTSGCSASDFSINNAAAGATSHDTTLAGQFAGNQTANNAVTLQMVETGANQNACQHVTVPLYFAAS